MGAAKRVLTEMIKSYWGPYKDFEPKLAAEYRDKLKFACDEILADILGADDSPYNGSTAQYWKDGYELCIDVRFSDTATMDAQHIAFEFRERADVPVRVFVSEQTSEFKSP